MILPHGVTYSQRQATLIATTSSDLPGLITIATGVKQNEDYVVSEVALDLNAEKRLKGDWADFDLLFRFQRQTTLADGRNVPTVIKSTAIHSGSPKLPNITVLPNLAIDEIAGISRPYTALGCDFGRYLIPEEGSPVREVVEFQTSGMMLVDRQRGELDLWVARAGDKIAVSAGSHATLYNLGDRDEPLVTLDYSNPRACSNVDPLAAAFGPPLLFYYDDFEVTLVVNRLYVTNPDMRGSLRLPHAGDQSARTVRLLRASRQDLGSFLHDQFVYNTELIGRLARLGINVRHATGEAILEPLPFGGAQRLFFSRPLANAVNEGTKVHRFFFPDAPACEPLPSVDWRHRHRDLIETRSVVPRPLHRPLVLLVEGAGDWVEQAYRKVFLAKANEGALLSVFYADDTRWKARPQWTNPEALNGLQSWETYLDKASPSDFDRYSMLRPDAVFVVTPDFMHSATATRWLDKTPTVFIEKPFDSDLRNVEGLQYSASRRQTEIVGLDHYQYYAGPLRELRSTIGRIVGETLKRVEFVLAEEPAIELGRERTLKHGLTLDLLPHFLALLTFFGDIGTIDEISIPAVWRYDPLESRSRDGVHRQNITEIFQNETAAVIDFTFEDHSGNGFPVPCRAVIGKGFERNVKYMQVQGTTGNSLRIDLLSDATKRPLSADPNYPWGSLFFVAIESGLKTTPVRDPYIQGTSGDILHILTSDDAAPIGERLEERYRRLVEDLLNGTESAVFASLSMDEGGSIVRALDRVWWAIQKSKPWQAHPIGKLDPIACLRVKA